MNEDVFNLPRPDQIEDVMIYRDAWKKLRNEMEQFFANISEIRFVEPRTDSWSASQIAEHIALTQERFARSIPLIFKGRLKTNKNDDAKPDYDLIENYFREHRKIQNPDSVTPVTTLKKTEAINRLRATMLLLEKNIAGKSTDELKNKFVEHPHFGHLSLVDAMWTQILHENHHFFLLRKKYS
jgi:hypothetical protein